jgi:hypothetical protein
MPTPTPHPALWAARADLVGTAQIVLDGWQQDEDGLDLVLGHGGACDLVASALAAALAEHGIEACVTGTEFDGGHAFVHALVDGCVWAVDIPASVYETGYGYTWTKRPGVQLVVDDLTFLLVASGVDEATFQDAYSGD